MAALEQQLGVTLFERVGKRMVLTATGQALLAQARAMGAAADALALMATGRSQAVEGVVSVSASDAVAAHILPRAVARLRQQAPGIVIEVVTTNQLSDLLRREADIAIRHVAPDQPDLIGRLIRHATAGFYASSAWVAAHGHPRTAADAAHCDFIGADRAGGLSRRIDARDCRCGHAEEQSGQSPHLQRRFGARNDRRSDAWKWSGSGAGRSVGTADPGCRA